MPSGQPADLVLRHGEVHTVNSANDLAQAIAVSGDRIVAVGSDAEVEALVGPTTRLIDLHDRAVLPGFVDNHIHLESLAQQVGWLDCSPGAVTSIADIVAGINARVATTPPGEWILGSRYQQDRLTERRHPTRHDLDLGTTNHPVGLQHASGMAWTFNSTALHLMKVSADTLDPPGGRIDRDEHGEPLGPLWNNARPHFIEPVLPRLSQADRVRRYGQLCRQLNRLGITSAFEAALRIPEQLDAWQTLRARGELSLRVNLDPYVVYSNAWESDSAAGRLFEAGVQTGLGDDWLRFGGLVIGIDGTGLGRTAALLEAYADDPTGTFRGMLRVTRDEACAFVQRGYSAGWQLSLVAMGDEGIQVALEAIEAAVSNDTGDPSAAHRPERHRLDHAYLWNESLLRRAAGLGIIWNTQPPLLQTYGRRSTVDAWGPHRAQWGFPFRAALAAGIVVSGGSDAPVASPDPLVGLDCLLTHRLEPDGATLNPNQRLSLDQALRVYTYNGAYASGEERRKGSLEVGKLADLVVLSGSLLEAAPYQVRDLTVDITLLAGAVAHEHQA